MAKKEGDAVTRITDAAEARERAKAHKALAKWLPMRRAQLALAGGGTEPDVEWAESLMASLAARVIEVDVEATPS